ncbi:MAG: flippase [Bacteroidales bacterium]|nr:flippase [Bacteroidales bacterium]MCF8405859.1 flippase [Bacteroidales bacterium]
MCKDNTPDQSTIDDIKYQSELVLITKNAGITASGYLLLNVFSFISNAIITRYIGADDYGLFVLATRILEIVIILSSLGFATTIIRHVAFFYAQNDHERTKGTIFYSLKVVFIVSVVGLVLFFILSPLISDKLFNRPEISPFLRILLLSLPFSMISMVFLSALNGLKKIKTTITIRNIINPVIYILIVGMVIIFDWGLSGLMWIYVITGSISAFLAYSYLRKAYLNKVADYKPIAEKKKLWNFSYPMLFIQLFNNIIRLVPVFIMGIYLTNTDIGIFNVSLKIAVLVSFALEAFAMIFSPVMAELFSKNDREMIRKLYKTVTKWIFTFSLVIFFIIILFSDTLLSIFGTEFIAGSIVLILIAFGELVNAGAGLVGNLILMSGRPRVILANSIFRFMLIVTLCLFLIPAMGLKGAAISVAISQATINLVRLAELYYFERIHPFKPSYIKPFISGVITFILVYVLMGYLTLNNYLELFVGSLIFLILYTLGNWAMQLDEEDKFVINILTKYIKR